MRYAGVVNAESSICFDNFGGQIVKASKFNLQNERGTTMLEYMFMAMLVLMICLAGITSLGTSTAENFAKEDANGTNLAEAMGG